MDVKRAFTLIELLVVMAVIAILAGLLFPTLARAKDRAKSVSCLGNLKQWGGATHLFTVNNDDLLPPEGSPTPMETNLQDPKYEGWYIQLPLELGLPRYADMPWRTNPFVVIPRNCLWICPCNPRRCDASSKTNNLFHYCLNENVNGTGETTKPRVRLYSIPSPSATVWLFDSKNLPAVGGWTFVHTNLHSRGAHFLFLDGHAARFKNTDYWDFQHHVAITNNPSLIWIP